MIRILCAAALLASTAAPALAQTAANGMTLAEMQAAADQRFDEADFDQSGVLSAAEIERAGQNGAAFLRADANRDGRVSRNEYRAAFAAMFARLDANSDGVISPEERRQFRGFDLGRGLLGGQGAPDMPAMPSSN